MEQAPARLERLAQDLAGNGLLRSSNSRDTLRRVELGVDMAAAAAQAAIVIECVPENLELKLVPTQTLTQERFVFRRNSILSGWVRSLRT